MRIEDFKYVDTAYGGAFNRNVIMTIPDVAPDPKQPDCFTSMFAFRKELLDHVEKAGTVRGLGSVPCWSPFIWFDIDSKDPADAVRWLHRLLDNIHTLDPLLSHITKTYYSGNKGFHVGIPSEAFGLTPDLELPYIMSELARKISFGAEIDKGIYQATRLWRLPGSKHGKTGLYKTLLNADDIRNLEDGIESLKEIVSDPGIPCFALAPPCLVSPAGVSLVEGMSDLIERKRRGTKRFTELRKKQTIIQFIKPCVESLLSSPTPEGARNEISIRLANDFRKRNYTIEDATDEMQRWNAEFCTPPLSDTELEAVVKSAYDNSQMDYGCNDIVLLGAQACKTCPLQKPELPDNISETKTKSYGSWRQISEEIFDLRSESGKTHERQLKILSVAVKFLNSRGVFYHTEDERAFFFDNETKMLRRLSVNHRDTMMLLGEMGLFKAENMFAYMAGALEFHGIKKGKLTTIYNTCYFNRRNNILYLSYGDTEVLKITADSVKAHPNGTDGVLFFKDAAIPPFKLGEKPEGLLKFRECLTDSINFAAERMTVEQRKKAFEAWVFSIFFAELMPTKPILCFLGEKGSGKSTTLRKIAKMIYGDTSDVFMVPHTPMDIELLMSTYHFLAFDNVDTKVRGLDDALAASATGSRTGKRQLYTDGAVHTMPVRCFLGITSRDPEFTRDDVADRLLLMHLDTLDRERFIPEHMIQENLLYHRSEILTEVVYHLQKIIQQYILIGNKNIHIKSRIADFGHFAFLVANIEGGTSDDVDKWLKQMVYEQTDFAVFDQPIFRLLETYMDLEGGIKKTVTPARLREDLRTLAKRLKIKFPEGDTQRRFSARIRHQFDSLQKHFDIDVIKQKDGHIAHYVINGLAQPDMEARFTRVPEENPEDHL